MNVVVCGIQNLKLTCEFMASVDYIFHMDKAWQGKIHNKKAVQMNSRNGKPETEFVSVMSVLIG